LTNRLVSERPLKELENGISVESYEGGSSID
jgi:hypothetical protein